MASITNNTARLSLSATIGAYEAGSARFDAATEQEVAAAGGSEAFSDQTFLPHQRSLFAWGSAAETQQDAVSALRFAKSEASAFGCDEIVMTMIDAAIGFLESPPH